MQEKLRKPQISYSIAKTRHDLEQAFALVYRQYLKKGYISKSHNGNLCLTLFNALPSSVIFIAKEEDRVIGTVTLIFDSPLGLPMDAAYKPQIDVLRKRGRAVAEVSQLAISEESFDRDCFSMFNFNKLMFIFRLFKMVLDYGRYHQKINDLCIAINPKQRDLYTFIGFENMAGLKIYGNANKALAVAKRLNLDSFKQKMRRRKALYTIFSSKMDDEVFKDKHKFTAGDLEYFFVKKSNVFEKATNRRMRYIRSCYPKSQS